MTGPTYATRESVKSTLDVMETARANDQIDSALESATEDIDGMLRCGRYGFSLLDATKYYDWPARDSGGAWALWLTDAQLISASSLIAGGVAVSSSDYYLSPENDGPPYRRLQLLRNTSATFGGGPTPQKQIAITGTWGCRDDRDTAGTLASSVTSSATTWALSNGGVAGVGDLLICDTERAVVTGRTWVDSTQTLGVSLASSNAATTLTPSGAASAFAAGESLMIDSESMLVTDVVGSTLTVRRAMEGTALAAHSSGAVVYANRGYTVGRGQMGTLAASHAGGATVEVHRPPALIAELCRALAITTLQQGRAGYARMVRVTNSDSGTKPMQLAAGITDLIERATQRWGRTTKVGAV